ncbi:alcohol dehydrogenase [Oleiphilus sp. HI0071]|nr:MULTISPECIES: iron-containing alcohol dehydrogenase [unclassified Oleiphilus]KZY74901.1 alcohol dehydrogenase [Oleiphilus sp. HI0065]KZY82016.1 alcohol dehydrogenase [Oleiphilus sp. HI0071]KZY91146.1 alcohol dehydrogenase [Oleiphilus sp. HI0073]KZZ42168.1 alcohol dehydrogenase [Oleiphilus sp. HI0118]KZZ60385.1 alcohol dehydrogenase [Oleiphilus sp. HI0122]KZZ64811.1 alcohol dehydrogenase [Oleiphilus sp. HI0130]KZZ81973.1 alcohol dehydrogenase [Oleiphilus sp. HI0133]
MNAFQFNTTKSIISEAGSLKRMGELCGSLEIGRPIVISDQGIVACGLLDQLKDAVSSTQLETDYFVDVVADPPEDVVLAAIECAKQHNADGVIGFGGGSSLDTAKLVAAALGSGQELQAMYGIDQVVGVRLPLILVSTTAGTGSEVTPISIVTTGETTKAGIVSSTLLPDIALLDAELTLGLPPHVTAATGVDAMVHAIEAYTSAIKKNPYSDLLAAQALRLLSDNIKQATYHGADIEARQNMLLGACLAGQAFANAPVAAVHALAYPLGGHFHIPHGLSNALVLPHVMRFNKSACGALYAQLIPYIAPDLVPPVSSESESEENQLASAVCRLIEYIEDLVKDLGLPTSLAEMGIEESYLGILADDAMLQTRLLQNNPKEVTRDDALAIYQAAFKGIV